MLTQVVLQTSNPMTFNIDDVDPDEILILKSISGLTPGDVTLYTGDFARNGGYYQGRRVGKRNPVFTFKLNPDYKNDIEVSDIREMLYRQFYKPQALTDGVQVLLKDDRKPDRYFIGYAEKWDGDIFSKDTSAQISTISVDAFLQSAEETVGDNPAGWLSVPIDYEGSADTGIEMTLKVGAATNQIIIDNNGILMTLVGTFAVNDVVYVNTIEGSRAIRQNGTDIMALLTGSSQWIQLTQAANTLRVYGTNPGDGKAAVTQYKYRAAWWGV